jgi:hypothetical protein
MDNRKSTVTRREGALEGTEGSDKTKNDKNKSSSSKEGRTRIRKFTQLRRGDHIKMLRWFRHRILAPRHCQGSHQR